MAKLVGVVQRNDLEGGFLELVCGEERYQLEGPGLPAPGARVEVEGKLKTAAFGIGMAGPIFAVKRWRAVDPL
jgi:hypothetical protein